MPKPKKVKIKAVTRILHGGEDGFVTFEPGEVGAVPEDVALNLSLMGSAKLINAPSAQKDADKQIKEKAKGPTIPPELHLETTKDE